MKGFISDVVKTEIDLNTSRIGLTIFSTHANISRPIQKWDRDVVDDYVNSIIWARGWTNTPELLSSTVTQFHNTFIEDRQQIIVMITDGNPCLPTVLGGCPSSVCAYDMLLKFNNVRVVVVAIDKGYDLHSLSCLTNNLIVTESFNETNFQAIRSNLSELLCSWSPSNQNHDFVYNITMVQSGSGNKWIDDFKYINANYQSGKSWFYPEYIAERTDDLGSHISTLPDGVTPVWGWWKKWDQNYISEDPARSIARYFECASFGFAKIEVDLYLCVDTSQYSAGSITIYYKRSTQGGKIIDAEYNKIGDHQDWIADVGNNAPGTNCQTAIQRAHIIDTFNVSGVGDLILISINWEGSWNVPQDENVHTAGFNNFELECHAMTISPTMSPTVNPTSPTESPTCTDYSTVIHNNADQIVNMIGYRMKMKNNSTQRMVTNITNNYLLQNIKCRKNDCEIICNSRASCLLSNITLDYINSLTVYQILMLCQEQVSCLRATMSTTDLSQNMDIMVVCNATESCEGMQIDLSNFNSFNILCSETGSCQDMEIKLNIHDVSNYSNNGNFSVNETYNHGIIHCLIPNACDDLIVTTNSNYTQLIMYEYSDRVQFDNGVGYLTDFDNIKCNNNRYIKYEPWTNVTISNSILNEYISNNYPCDDVKVLCNSSSCNMNYFIDSVKAASLSSQGACHWINVAEIQTLDCIGECMSSPTSNPTHPPTSFPTKPSLSPTKNPTIYPTIYPAKYPTKYPTNPSQYPSVEPSVIPSINPSKYPSIEPSVIPSFNPTMQPFMTPT
eukprot:414864_1